MAILREEDANVNVQLKVTFTRVAWWNYVIAVALILVICIISALTIHARLLDSCRLGEKRIYSSNDAELNIQAGLLDSSTSEIDKDFFPDAKPLQIVTRDEWLAQPPKEVLTPLKLPVNRVIITHTSTEGCTTQTSCVYRVRFIQEQHIGSQNFGDIGYNFLIGGDGNVYEGRGWLTVGAFLIGQNSKSEGIAFIGNYNNMAPTDEQMQTLEALLENGVKKGYITSDFKLYGARQWQATQSPGIKLYERLKKHKHWSDDISN